MITYKMHLIRTGSTSTGTNKRYVGQTDLPLSQQGMQELEQLRRECEYPKVQMVFTSPLSRCVQTADLLYPDCYTQTVDALQDLGLGEFEGHTFDQLKEKESFGRWMANSFENPPPGGESAVDFGKRIVSATGVIFHQMMEERMTNVAVITHGGVIMTLLAAIGVPREPLHQWATGNGTGYTLMFTPQMWMRDQSAEIFCRIPDHAVMEGLEAFDDYFEKE